jgi:hypothetical protein
MTNPFRYFETSPEIIRLAVMMCVRFPLSRRNIEDLLHERRVNVSHETIRFRTLRPSWRLQFARRWHHWLHGLGPPRDGHIAGSWRPADALAISRSSATTTHRTRPRRQRPGACLPQIDFKFVISRSGVRVPHPAPEPSVTGSMLANSATHIPGISSRPSSSATR